MKKWLLIIVLVQAGFCQQHSQMGGGSGGTHSMGGWPFNSQVKLPHVWVNALEYQNATSNTANFPAQWSCAGGTNYGPYTTGSPGANMAALQLQVNDAETCRTLTNTGTQILIPAQMVFSNNIGLGLPQTAGDNSTKFIVLQSTTPLPLGRTVCSHGTQDNLPQSVRPGIRNLGCNGQNLSYQLGLNVTQVPPGAFTLANGVQTDTASYNDIASMYTLESTQVNGNAIWTQCADGTSACNNVSVGPHHFAVLNAEVRMGAGLVTVSAPIRIGQGNETAVSQIPSHMHFAYLYVHGDWSDAPVSGNGASAVATSSPQGANSYPNNIVFQGCIYCSVAWTYHDKSLRPGMEGHVIAMLLAQEIKIVHNWLEGHSVNHMCGGWGGPISLNPWTNGAIDPSKIFVACQDMEDRGNRWTYPYSWILAYNAPGPVGPFRPASTMTTTNTTTPSASGLLLNLQGVRNGAIFSYVLQAGGSGYNLNDIVTAQQAGLGQNATFLVNGVSGGVVSGVTIASGTGYSVTSTPANTTGGGGNGMTVNITSVGPGGQITGATMATPGSNYTNTSLITVVGGTNGRVQPTAVSGVVTAINVLTPGANYNTTAPGTPATTTTASGGGSGMTVNITSVDTGGQLLAVTIASPGSGYSTNSVINVTQAGASGGQIQPATVTNGVPTAINVISGTGYQVNSFARKNAHEYKFSDRALLDGNIFENVDYSGAQGTTASFKMNQTSASNLGSNYWTIQTNSTMTNSIVRNGCNGTSMGFRSNWTAGGGVGMRADYYTYTNNLVYNVAMGNQGNPGCQQSPGPYDLRVAAATNGTTWGQVQSSPTIINTPCPAPQPCLFPGDVVTVSRDATGQTATLILGGWGQGYTAGGPTLTTTTTAGNGSGLTVNVLSVDSHGQITGVSIFNPGTGYTPGEGLTVQSQAGTTIPATLTILGIGGSPTGPAAGIALGIPGKGISGFSPGDIINVNCPNDASFNAPSGTTAWPIPTGTPTIGAKVISAQTYGMIVSYHNVGTPNATSSGCYVTNVQGDPSYLYANHNTHFMTLNSGQKPGDPASDNMGGSGNFCGMATGITFINSIALGGGATASSLGEGTRTTQCAFDGNQPGSLLNYNHVTHPGRASLAVCSPQNGMACYTEYDSGTPLTPPTTIWGTLTPHCVGNDPSAEDCQGVVGNMGVGSTGTFNYALPNWHDYRLCHATDTLQCNGIASPYAAGGSRQATDGTDLGVNMSALDNAQTLLQYPAAGSFPDR